MRRLALSGAAALAAYSLLARPRQLRWGATTAESAAHLAGDDLIATPDLESTRAIGIQAPPGAVWPWIAQLGQGRGGFYSYDRLENLAGCNIHSADHVLPEHQVIRVGDEIRLHPEVALAVAACEPGHSLVLRGGVPMGKRPPPYDFTWAFIVAEEPDGTTRLIVRERYAYTKWWAPLLVEPVEAISFVMSQKMLRTIRDAAQRGSGPQRAGLTPSVRT